MSKNKYLQALIASFYQEVNEVNLKKPDQRHTYYGVVLYHKWTSTVELSNQMNEPVCKVRAELSRLEKEGKVTAKRASNWINWAANEIPGFKQHQFTDYYCMDSNISVNSNDAPIVFDQ